MINKEKLKDYLTSYLFILPYVVFFILFLVIPIIYGMYISLHKWDILSKVHPYVGFKNYVSIFTKGTHVYDIFWSGLWTTIKFVICSVPPLVIIGLLLALIINSLVGKVQVFFRSLYFLPYIISVTAVAVIWLWTLDTNSGLLNHYLYNFFKIRIPWLNSQPWVWVSMVVTTVWWTVGFNMIIFQAAIADIPQQLYEAAAIDGANSWNKFIKITIPSLKPILVFVLITTTIASFNVFGQAFLMTRGGPGTDTKVLLMYIYEEAFSNLNLGNATAMSLMMSLIMIILTLIISRLNKKN